MRDRIAKSVIASQDFRTNARRFRDEAPTSERIPMLSFRSKKKVGPPASLHGAKHCQATGDADFNGLCAADLRAQAQKAYGLLLDPK